MALTTWRYLARRRQIKETLVDLIEAYPWKGYASVRHEDRFTLDIARAICFLMIEGLDGEFASKFKEGNSKAKVSRLLCQLDILLGRPSTSLQWYIAYRRVMRLLYSNIQQGKIVISPAIGECRPRQGKTILQFRVYAPR